MSRDKQIDVIYEDLVEIFDEEYNRRNLITPQNTAERMTAKGYRKASEVAREIFAEIERIISKEIHRCESIREHYADLTQRKYWEGGESAVRKTRYWIAELKKKYTVTDTNVGCKTEET